MEFEGKEIKVGDVEPVFNKNRKKVGQTKILEIDEDAKVVKVETSLITGQVLTMTIHAPSMRILAKSERKVNG